MSIQIYKPNRNNTGHAVTFSYSERHECVYLEIIKQASWDGRNGSFAANRKKPGMNLNVKIGLVEVGALLNTLERKSPAKLFHSFGESTTTVNFTPWIKKDEPTVQQGYSLAISNKGAGSDCQFLVGFSMDEGRLLREYLIYSLRQLFFAKDKEFKNRPAAQIPQNDQNPPESEVEVQQEAEPVPEDAVVRTDKFPEDW